MRRTGHSLHSQLHPSTPRSHGHKTPYRGGPLTGTHAVLRCRPAQGEDLQDHRLQPQPGEAGDSREDAQEPLGTAAAAEGWCSRRHCRRISGGSGGRCRGGRRAARSGRQYQDGAVLLRLHDRRWGTGRGPAGWLGSGSRNTCSRGCGGSSAAAAATTTTGRRYAPRLERPPRPSRRPPLPPTPPSLGARLPAARLLLLVDAATAAVRGAGGALVVRHNEPQLSLGTRPVAAAAAANGIAEPCGGAAHGPVSRVASSQLLAAVDPGHGGTALSTWCTERILRVS